MFRCVLVQRSYTRRDFDCHLVLLWEKVKACCKHFRKPLIIVKKLADLLHSQKLSFRFVGPTETHFITYTQWQRTNIYVSPVIIFTDFELKDSRMCGSSESNYHSHLSFLERALNLPFICPILFKRDHRLLFSKSKEYYQIKFYLYSPQITNYICFKGLYNLY